MAILLVKFVLWDAPHAMEPPTSVVPVTLGTTSTQDQGNVGHVTEHVYPVQLAAFACNARRDIHCRAREQLETAFPVLMSSV